MEEQLVPDYLSGEKLLLYACNESLVLLRNEIWNTHDYVKASANMRRIDQILQEAIDKYEIESRSNG
jgi:hypothetical protein